METSIWSPLRPEKRTWDGTVARQFAVTQQMGSSPISCVGLFQEKTEQNQKRIFALVPRRGANQTRLVNSLSCPTFANGPIESQWVFSRLSHRFSAALHVRFSLHKRTSTGTAGMSAKGPEGDMATTREERPELRSSGLECFAKLCDHGQRYCGAVVPVTRLALVALGVFSGTGHAAR
jgi:hypothetical protein